MFNSRLEDRNFYSHASLNCKGELIFLNNPLIMGIINCNSNSFYKKSRETNLHANLKKIEQMIQDGADIIDIGAQSTRPNGEIISENEEIEAVLPLINEVKKHFPEIKLSLDTFRANVAAIGLENEVDIINDISFFNFDENMLQVLEKHKPIYIGIHTKGAFETMHNTYQYQSLFKEMYSFFSEKIKILHQLGLKDIVLDPGFGFSKNVDQNFELLAQLHYFNTLKKPLLAGISRKSMIYKSLNITSEEALNGTSILNTLSLMQNVKFLRVHDVKEVVEVRALIKKTNLK